MMSNAYKASLFNERVRLEEENEELRKTLMYACMLLGYSLESEKLSPEKICAFLRKRVREANEGLNEIHQIIGEMKEWQ